MKCHIENEKKMSMFFKAVFPPIFGDFKTHKNCMNGFLCSRQLALDELVEM